MTYASEITCTITNSKKWFFWPAFYGLWIACQIGMSPDKAVRFLIDRCMRLEIHS